MNADEITAQIMEAWDEVSDPVAEAEPETEELEDEEEVELDPAAEAEPAEEEEDEDEEEEPVEEEPAEEEADEDESEEEPAEPAVEFETDDVEVRAFLAKYSGDVGAALKGAAELYQLVSRQGREKNEALARAAELETELDRARFAQGGPLLNEEQQAWVEEATGSGSPAAYIQQAIDVGELELARAVVREWARDDPYNAMRAGTHIDQVEQSIAAYREPVNMPVLLEAIGREVPDLPVYSAQMTEVLQRLGPEHPLAQEARSSDVQVAAAAIIGIYEIAKLSSVNTRTAREKVKADARENGASARKRAVVSSGSASPSATETPRTRQLMPGLTLEDLEAEFARQ